MGTPGTVSKALFGEVCRAAAVLGYRLPQQQQHDYGARVPLRHLLGCLAEWRKQSGDADIGLRIGRALNPRCFAIAGYLVMAGPTLLHALPRIARYQRLVADGIALDIRANDSDIRLDWKFVSVQPSPELVDLLMAGIRCCGAWLLGTEPPLLQVRFAYPARASATLHREIVGPDLHFDSADSGFSLSRRWFEQPIRTGDPSLVPLLETYAEQLLGVSRRDRGLAAISEVLLRLIPHGQVEITAVAAELGRSPRTLQRTLRRNGTSFHRLLQELRLQLAHEYFGEPGLTLRDIAARLGYQEQSSFCHAYRQWTGRSPGDARKALKI